MSVTGASASQRVSAQVERGSPEVMRLAVVAWLAWLVVPVTGLLGAGLPGARLALVLAAIGTFVGLYLRVMLTCMAARQRELAVSLVVMAGLAFLVWTLAGDALAFLPVYVSVAAAATIVPLAHGMRAVLAVTATTAMFVAQRGTWTRMEVVAVLMTAGLGMSLLGWTQLQRTIVTLKRARANVVRLAVAEERLRMSRDLHDLLGQSLSLITLKSEMARRALPADPRRAEQEIADVEERARTALDEVRAVVAGSRKVGLEDECRSAETVLRAAGIEATIDLGDVEPPATTEPVLAWAVREAVTNVVRHSRARHCTIRLLHNGRHVGVEVSDDGQGLDADVTLAEGVYIERYAWGGHGLTGLRERIETCGGRLEVASPAGHGFTMRAWLRVPAPGRRPDGQTPGRGGQGFDGTASSPVAVPSARGQPM